MTAPPVVYTNGSWETYEPWDIQINGVTLHIPKGFRTDLASIPVLIRGLPGLASYQLGGVGPPLIHDFLYQARGECRAYYSMIGAVILMPAKSTPPTRFTRRATDRIFREAMTAGGVGFVRRNLAWGAVRLLGWIPWKPTRTAVRNVVTRAGWAGTMAAGATTVCVGLGWSLWLVGPLAGVLSAVKTVVQQTPLAERVKDTLYR